MSLSCCCNDISIVRVDKCVVCNKTRIESMNEFERKRICPIHKPDIVMFCGECKFVCPECTNIGWESTAGTGGGDYIVNYQTNEEIIDGKKVYHYKLNQFESGITASDFKGYNL